MAPEIHSHAVFGFSESLDWTPLHFVKPIDDIRVCSACRAVARKTAFLACRHVLCEPCYEHWKSRGSHLCFLDGDLCPENEVHWMEFPAEKMMKAEVSCWNRENGCDIITDVSSITDHFHRDCEHHSACCPKCSSTVLRKDIMAHLESQCANHVLRVNPTPPPSEGEQKNLQGFREGVRGIKMAFRNASLNDASLVTSIHGPTARDEQNADSLSKMAAEVAQMSEVTKQKLSAVERSSEGRVNQIADMKTCKENLCAELDEIKKAVNELGPCKSPDQQEMTDTEEYVMKFQALKAEIQSLSSILGELTNKISLEAAVAESAPSDGVSAVLSCNLSSTWMRRRPVGSFPLKATARVFENELKAPVKVVWCVHEWSVLIHEIKEKNFGFVQTSIAVDDKYVIHLCIHGDAADSQLFRIMVSASGSDDGTFETSPKNITFFFLKRKERVVKYKINIPDAKLWRVKWPFFSDCLSLKYLERCGIIQGDVLKVCLKFSY